MIASWDSYVPSERRRDFWRHIHDGRVQSDTDADLNLLTDRLVINGDRVQSDTDAKQTIYTVVVQPCMDESQNSSRSTGSSGRKMWERLSVGSCGNSELAKSWKWLFAQEPWKRLFWSGPVKTAVWSLSRTRFRSETNGPRHRMRGWEHTSLGPEGW